MSEQPRVPASIEALKSAWAKVAAFAFALPKPAKIFAVTTVLAAIVIGAWLGLRTVYEPYSVLFSQLDDQDAAAVVAKLKELKVPYRINSERGSIDVPEARVHELRMELAGQGIVRGGGVGFEGFDKMRLGATEFEQRVMYRRAMEGELARTIGSIGSVQTARVHLVLPEKSVFAARREPASASVVVRLRPGHQLGSGEVGSVVNLVAAAVPGLEPDKVSLVTTEGQVLHRPRPTGPDGVTGFGSLEGDDITRARAVEAQLEERARAMLERVVGASHADVRVSAEIDLARVERVEDRYDPARTVVRSETQTIERSPTDGADDTAAGVPGAESNLPDGTPPEPAPSANPNANITRESHTRNFEVDHVTEKRVNLQGAIRRLTVAVVVDGVPGPDGAMEPRSREDLDKLEGLVRSAVGVDPRREDVITVESIPFLPTNDVDLPADAPAEAPAIPAVVRRFWPAAAGALGLLTVAVIALAMRRSRRRAAAKSAGVGSADEPIQLTTTPVPDKLGAAPGANAPQIAAPDYREEALRRAKEDPATAALVLRHWLGTAVEETHAASNAA